MGKPLLIAEIKTRSPYGYVSANSFATLMDYALEFGDWISVHDNALWGGDFDTISFVRNYTKKPILAKGLHGTDEDIRRALDHGADYVLVVDRLPMPGGSYKKCIIEHGDFAMVQYEARVHPNTKFVCNSRNLKTGLPKKRDELLDYLKLKVWTCQASGIISPAEVREGVDAYLVGEHLVQFCERLKCEQ